MFQLIKQTNIDFVGKRRIALIISAVVIIVGLISLVIQGGPRLSIDFEGGTLIEVRFNSETTVEAVRTQMSAVDLGEAVIQQFGDTQEYLIRVKTPTQDEEVLNGIFASLEQVEGGNGFEVRRLETADLNGDGISDLFVQKWEQAHLTVFLSQTGNQEGNRK